jgi:CubicO group peptidase (beta-lactamase class C family)
MALNWSAAEATARGLAGGWDDVSPGGAIVLFDRAGARLSAGFGLASIEHAIRFTADTPTRYASISKHMLCAILRDDGRIGLDDTLGAHLAPLALAAPLAAVTVGRALDMTGGLPDTLPTSWQLGIPPTASLTRDALLGFVARFPDLNFPAGAEISYSNTGYRLVQAALEAKGVSYRDAVRRLVAPLGLGMLMPDDEAEPVAHLATGYFQRPDEAAWRRGRYGMHFSASGGIVGSAHDLARWAGHLMTDDALLAALSAPRHLADGRPTAYGLGLARHDCGGRTLFGHGGSLPGYKDHFLIDPDSGAGVVVLSNREATAAADIALQIMASLLGATLPPLARGMLPDGLFVAADGPFWLEHKGGRASFLGAEEALYDHGDGWATGRSAHLPMRLRRDGAGIAGEIGHVARSFVPVAAEAAPSPEWNGIWTLPAEGASFAISSGRLTRGVGPLRETVTLQPLDDRRALAPIGDGGPWQERLCLSFAGDTAHMAVNRSRILRFRRVSRSPVL